MQFKKNIKLIFSKLLVYFLASHDLIAMAESHQAIHERNHQFLNDYFQDQTNSPIFKVLKDLKYGQDKIDQDLLKKFINKKTCQYNFQYFVGCLESLKTVFTEFENLKKEETKKITLATTENIQLIKDQKEDVVEKGQIGVFTILENKNTPDSNHFFLLFKQNELNDYAKLFKHPSLIESLIFILENKVFNFPEHIWAKAITKFFINARDPHSILINLTAVLKSSEKTEMSNYENDVFEFNNKKFLLLTIPSMMQANICETVKTRLAEANIKNDIYAVIFDLRNNPGGYTSNAICIASLVLDPFSIVFAKHEKNYTEEVTTPFFENPIYEGRMAVLINQNTASGAEILSQSLKDYQRALIVGERSFGKGTQQNIKAIQITENYFLNLTTSLLYSPKGESLQTLGVTPHLESRKSPDNLKTTYLREDNMYYFPILPKKIQTNFEPSIYFKINLNQQCFQEHDTKKIYRDLAENDKLKDLQLLTALTGLTCLEWNSQASGRNEFR